MCCCLTWISLSCPRGMWRNAAVTLWLYLSLKSSLVVIRGRPQNHSFLQNGLWPFRSWATFLNRIPKCYTSSAMTWSQYFRVEISISLKMSIAGLSPVCLKKYLWGIWWGIYFNEVFQKSFWKVCSLTNCVSLYGTAYTIGDLKVHSLRWARLVGMCDCARCSLTSHLVTLYLTSSSSSCNVWNNNWICRLGV